MKTRLGLTWVCLALIASAQVATAQEMMQPYGGPVSEQGNFQPVRGDLNVGMPGRIWFESNIADRGLGYNGSYLTLGGKSHLFQDIFDGRWLGEVQGHFSTESGRFFGNVGLERVFSIKAAGADVSLGGWFDYDDDQQGDFAHTFTQAGVTGAIKTQRWDLIGNGYFPIGTTDYALGDPTGQNCFLNNSIVLVPGIDSALKGFDVTMRVRPRNLAMVNGTVDFGGYGYSSDLIPFFGGGRVRLGMQILKGLILNAEVNQDDRFNTTGVLQVGYIFGANARGNEYSMAGRDLESTLRNDHIVRFQQDLVLAIDPDTGAPYNVYHVDNTADVTIGDGRFETPFTTLLNAQNASSTDAIIFVREGDGTTTGMNNGIVLKDRQMLLGDGVRHIIPVQNGQFFELCNDQDGIRPRIAGKNNGNAVTLANDNVVRGFIIDGSAGGMANGIFGDGVLAGAPINNGVIEDNEIFGAILHGVFINDLSGDWNFARNDIHDNGFDGILLTNASDPTSVFNYEENNVSSNGRDGIHMVNYDAERITFLRNITNNNGRDGVRLENFTNGSGDGLVLRFLGAEASANSGTGLNILDGDGDLRFLNSLITNNLVDGIHIRNWTTTDPSDITLIGTTTGGTSTITGNGAGAGAGINNELGLGTQRLLITSSVVDGNGTGIRSVADGLATNLRTHVVDNFSVSNNGANGILIGSTGGAFHSALIDGGAGGFARLDMTGNGALGGHGIRLVAGDLSGSTSSIAAEVRNVDILGTATGHGLLADVIDDGNLQLTFENADITGSAGDGIHLNFDTNGNLAVNTVQVRNVNLVDNGDNGIDLATGNETFTDLSIFNSTLTNTTILNGLVVAGGTNGLSITATGDTVVPAIVDNRTRVFVQGTTISNFIDNGVLAVTGGDAHLFLTLDGNQIIDNGPSAPPTDVPNLPYFHGIALLAADTSVLNSRITNNLVTRNYERGLIVNAADDAQINIFMAGNNMSGNDIGEDIPNNPIIDSGIQDLLALNVGPNSRICMALTGNFFTLDAEFNNNGFPLADFRVELDGATNGFLGGTTFVGTSFPAFGAFCVPAITAEELAFLADGFPPQ